MYPKCYISAILGFNITIVAGIFAMLFGRLLSDELGRRLPLGMRQLDWLVGAASQDSQLSSLPHVLCRFPASNMLWAGALPQTHSAFPIASQKNCLLTKPKIRRMLLVSAYVIFT